MRYGLFLVGISALCMLGCSGNEPKVSRGPTKPVRDAMRAHGDEEVQSRDPVAQKDPDGKVRFGSVMLTIPQGWERKVPQSSFTQAEFALPRSSGDDADGRLTLSQAGGSIEANIERWKSQFSGAQGPPKQEQIDAGGLKVTIVDLAGEFNDQRGPFAPAVKRSGYRMIAAIIPVEGELHFIKAVGPQKTIEANKEKIVTFIKSAKRME